MSSNISLSSISISRNSREFEEKRNKERKLHLICLIRQYLHDEGYLDSAMCLMNEAPMTKHYGVCDNIDLATILQEYENYYCIRFQKYPKICKKVTESDFKSEISESLKRKASVRPFSVRAKSGDNLLHKYGEVTKEDAPKSFTSTKVKAYPMSNVENHGSLDLGLTILPLGSSTSNPMQKESEEIPKSINVFEDVSPEWNEMVQEIAKNIRCENPNVHWNDIIGHEDAKRILKEAVVYPIHYPELFTGILGPWKGLLLYGPPGTGKSLLAKAVATECNSTIISVSPSTVSSKWRGDSEKLVKAIFDLARRNAPSIILMEELDSLASRRGVSLEHEASRRMKTELFLQMDRLFQHNDCMQEDRIFFMCTSNIPWEIDPAMLRRIEKRVLIDLPTIDERHQLFAYFLPHEMREEWNGPSLSCQLDYSELAKVSEGYSGSDIKLVCKESVMDRMREVFSALEKSGNSNSEPLTLQKITNKDVITALMKTKPSATKESIKCNKWKEEFGSA